MLRFRASASNPTTQSGKSLSTSITRCEAKTPEVETVSESMMKKSKLSSKPMTKKKMVSAPAIKSSPLSSRAMKVKQSLREKVEVLAVLLKEDGTSQEVKYNGSSKQANIILGGRPTIIGEFEEIGVIIVRSLNQSMGKLNKTILPVPFCNKQFNGPYLLYKIGRDGIPSNFRLSEYVKFEQQNKGLTESARKNYNPIDDQQIRTKSSLSSKSKLTLVYLRSEVDKKVRAEYEKKHGKKPTNADIEQEVNEAVQKLVDELVSDSSPMNDPDYNPSFEDEEKGDDKASIIAALKRVYKEENMGKDINNKELMSSLKNSNLLFATEQNPDFDDERDWRLQLNDALNYVRERGRLDGRLLAEKISETYYELNGAEPSLDELIDVFRRIKDELAIEAEQDLIEQGYIKNMKDLKDNGSALYLAKKLGSDFTNASPSDIIDYAFRIVKEDFISRSKSLFKSTKGRLPNDMELGQCVESLALKLASEALETSKLMDDAQSEYDSVADPDYDPNNLMDKRQLKEDKELDQFDSDYFNLRMLTTESKPSLKTGKSQRYDVYFCKFSKKRQEQNLEKAVDMFKLRNKREPNAIEISKIKQFISMKPANNLIQFKLSVVSDSDNDDEDDLKRSELLKETAKTGPTTPSKVLVTPVKEKKTSKRYEIYLGDDKLDTKKNELAALKWFKRFNHRAPNELETAGIKQFVAADKSQLMEVQYEVPIDFDKEMYNQKDDDDRKDTEEDDMDLEKRLKFNEKDVMIKKKNKSTKYTLNFDNEDERENGNQSQAIKWFKRFNNRAPNKSEIEQIKSFIKADAENAVDID